MGTVVWSADTLIVSFLQPSVWSYNNEKYQAAAVLMDGLNEFFLGFGVGLKNVPKPFSHDKKLVNEFNQTAYAKKWFEMYFPLISKSMGVYLRHTIDLIKVERGV